MYQAGVKVLTIVQKLTKGGVLFLQVANLPIPTINLIMLLVVCSAKGLICILNPEDFLAAHVSLPPQQPDHALRFQARAVAFEHSLCPH
jgi:hypothetical protein